jgi:Fe-S cluster assembly protein SufD
MVDKDYYISTFTDHQERLARDFPTWFRKLGRTAMERFAETGFPSTKHEDWRFTRVRPLLQHEFKPTEGYRQNGLSAKRLKGISYDDTNSHRLVFVNGHYAGNLSNPGALPQGVMLGSLREMLRGKTDLAEGHLAKHADPANNPFVALNTAYMIDGVFLYLPEGTVVENPIHVLFVSTSDKDPVTSHPRNLLIAEKGSVASIVESYVSPGDDLYFTNAVSEIVVGDNAHIDHYKLQRESEEAFHFATVQCHLGRDSRFTTNSISLGGALVRNDVNAYLGGEGIECTLDGLYMANGHQHVDNHTSIQHARPHCNSHELYKGILSGRAKAVFNGRIHVHPDAQKTDAKQTNRCMLLSKDAQINTNPQLEIFADDVKCTHGAAVGQIDEDSIFYLRSRGIDEAQARHMLVYAFANDVLEHLGVEEVRRRLADDFFAWLSSAPLS